MVLPNFLVIGAQKAGTTWASEVLRAHPEVFVVPSELEYFSYAANSVGPNVPGYLSHFAAGEGKLAIGEKTASYLWASESPLGWGEKPEGFARDIPYRVMRTLGPELKLVACLRNPIERAVSAYLHHLRFGSLTLDVGFREAVRAHGIVHMGFYHAHLTRWLAVYGREQFLVLVLDDVAINPGASCAELYRFLGVRTDFAPPAGSHVVFPGVARSWHGQELYVSRDLGPLRETKADLVRVVDAGDLAWLRAVYQEDVERLSRLLGLDLAKRWAVG